jgi:hypothetical protein
MLTHIWWQLPDSNPCSGFRPRRRDGDRGRGADRFVDEGRVALWSSISWCGHAAEARVSRFGISHFADLFLSSWPQRGIELFAEPMRRNFAEFSALGGLGRGSEPYAARVATQLVCNIHTHPTLSKALRETFHGLTGKMNNF